MTELTKLQRETIKKGLIELINHELENTVDYSNYRNKMKRVREFIAYGVSNGYLINEEGGKLIKKYNSLIVDRGSLSDLSWKIDNELAGIQERIDKNLK